MYANNLVDTLIELLVVIGDQLMSLHLTINELLDAKTLRRVLLQCTNLRSLSVCHSGALWADVELAMMMSELQELELRIGTVASVFVRLAPLAQACLPHLVALRVQRQGQPDPIPHHAETSLLPFLKHNRSLQYVHWSNRDLVRSSWIGIAYKELDKADVRWCVASTMFLKRRFPWTASWRFSVWSTTALVTRALISTPPLCRLSIVWEFPICHGGHKQNQTNREPELGDDLWHQKKTRNGNKHQKHRSLYLQSVLTT